MQKNTAGKWIVFAFQDEGGSNPGDPVTGDAANITANVRIDGGAANAVDDTNPTELEDGYYIFDMTAAETNGDLLLLAPASSTANTQVIGVPGAVWTSPANFNNLGIASDGDISGNVDGNVVGSVASVTGAVGSVTAGVTISGTKTTLDALNDISTGDVNAEMDTALSDIHLDHLFAVDYDPDSKPGTSTALLNELIESDAGVSRYTANALEQAPSGSGGDATAANQTTIITHLTDMKGTGFAKDTHSLTDITADVTGLNGDAMRGTDSALLASSAPTNFGDLSITATTGRVDVASVAGTAQTAGDLAALITTVDGVVDNILVDTNELQTNQGDWVTATGFSTLTEAQVNAQVDLALNTAIPGSPTAGSINDVVKDLDAVLPASAIAAVTDVDAVIKTDTYTLPGQGAPTATPTLEEAIMYLYKAFRNQQDQTSSTWQLYADDASTVDQKATVTDAAGTTTRGELVSGP